MIKIIVLTFSVTILPSVVFSQELVAPSNFRAELNQEGKNIRLSWEKSEGDIAGYNLFVKIGNQVKFSLWGHAGLINVTSFDFKILKQAGETYEFKICAVQNFPNVTRSDFSNIVVVEVTSQHLPVVGINDPIVKKNTATITWRYKNTATDMVGFILFIDGEEILVKREDRNYLINNLTSGKHIVQIVAYTKAGLRSKMSNKKFVIVK